MDGDVVLDEEKGGEGDLLQRIVSESLLDEGLMMDDGNNPLADGGGDDAVDMEWTHVCKRKRKLSGEKSTDSMAGSAKTARLLPTNGEPGKVRESNLRRGWAETLNKMTTKDVVLPDSFSDSYIC